MSQPLPVPFQNFPRLPAIICLRITTNQCTEEISHFRNLTPPCVRNGFARRMTVMKQTLPRRQIFNPAKYSLEWTSSLSQCAKITQVTTSPRRQVSMNDKIKRDKVWGSLAWNIRFQLGWENPEFSLWNHVETNSVGNKWRRRKISGYASVTVLLC